MKFCQCRPLYSQAIYYHSSVITVLLSQFCYHSSAITVLLSQFCYNGSAITVLLSQFCYHSSAITVLQTHLYKLRCVKEWKLIDNANLVVFYHYTNSNLKSKCTAAPLLLGDSKSYFRPCGQSQSRNSLFWVCFQCHTLWLAIYVTT